MRRTRRDWSNWCGWSIGSSWPVWPNRSDWRYRTTGTNRCYRSGRPVGCFWPNRTARTDRRRFNGTHWCPRANRRTRRYWCYGHTRPDGPTRRHWRYRPDWTDRPEWRINDRTTNCCYPNKHSITRRDQRRRDKLRFDFTNARRILEYALQFPHHGGKYARVFAHRLAKPRQHRVHDW